MVKTLDDIENKYPESREEMTEEREKEYIADCFVAYENEQMSEKFWSPFGDYEERFGQHFKVVNRCDENGCHLGALPMWNIQFDDGTVIGAYPEEIVLSEMIENGYKPE